MARIVGLLFSGFTVRIYAIIAASYVAYTVGTYVIDTMNKVSNAMNVVG